MSLKQSAIPEIIENYFAIGQLSAGASGLIVRDVLRMGSGSAENYANQLAKKIGKISNAKFVVEMKTPWVTHDSHTEEHTLIARIKVTYCNYQDAPDCAIVVENEIYKAFAKNCIYVHLHNVARLDSTYMRSQLEKIKIKIKIKNKPVAPYSDADRGYDCKDKALEC